MAQNIYIAIIFRQQIPIVAGALRYKIGLKSYSCCEIAFCPVGVFLSFAYTPRPSVHGVSR